MSAAHGDASPTMTSGVVITTSLIRLAQLARAAFGSLVVRYNARVALRDLTELDDRMLTDVGLERRDLTSAQALSAKARQHRRRGEQTLRAQAPANQNRIVRTA